MLIKIFINILKDSQRTFKDIQDVIIPNLKILTNRFSYFKKTLSLNNNITLLNNNVYYIHFQLIKVLPNRVSLKDNNKADYIIKQRINIHDMNPLPNSVQKNFLFSNGEKK